MKLSFRTAYGLTLLLLGIVVGMILHRPAVVAQSPVSASPELPDVARLFSLGLSLPSREQEQAEFLTQLSLRHQESNPTLVPSLWLRYQDYLEKQGLTPEDYLLRLDVFLESIDKSALACDTESGFMSVWKVRKQVLAQRQTKVDSLTSALNEKLDALLEDVQAKSREGNRMEAIALAAERGEVIVATIRAVKTAWATDHQAMLSLEEKIECLLTEVLSVVTAQLSDLRKERDVEAAKDTSGNTSESVVGDASDEKGAYEALAHRIAQLRDRLDEADLPTWLSVFGEAKGVSLDKGGKSTSSENVGNSEAMLADVHTQIDRLLADVSRLQGLRYNLWSLKTIYRAQQSSNWDGLLGRIDVGLLQPTVSALYSTTYDSLIRDKTDPRTRIVAVQNILNGKKAALASF